MDVAAEPLVWFKQPYDQIYCLSTATAVTPMSVFFPPGTQVGWCVHLEILACYQHRPAEWWLALCCAQALRHVLCPL